MVNIYMCFQSKIVFRAHMMVKTAGRSHFSASIDTIDRAERQNNALCRQLNDTGQAQKCLPSSTVAGNTPTTSSLQLQIKSEPSEGFFENKTVLISLAAAGGGIVVLLVVILLAILCKTRHQHVTHVSFPLVYSPGNSEGIAMTWPQLRDS